MRPSGEPILQGSVWGAGHQWQPAIRHRNIIRNIRFYIHPLFCVPGTGPISTPVLPPWPLPWSRDDRLSSVRCRLMRPTRGTGTSRPGTPEPLGRVPSVVTEPGGTEEDDRPIVAFDFDGTITKQDTLRFFLVRIRRKAFLGRAFLRRTPELVAALQGGAARDRAKVAICREVLGGLPRQRAEEAAADTARVVLGGLLRPDTTERIRWHQAAGHRIIVVSASFEAYVTLVAASLGIDEVIATRWELEPTGEVLTGGLDGLNVRGEAKVALLDAHVGRRCHLEYAYGNSSGDTAMLARARNPEWVARRSLPPLGGPPT